MSFIQNGTSPLGWLMYNRRNLSVWWYDRIGSYWMLVILKGERSPTYQLGSRRPFSGEGRGLRRGEGPQVSQNHGLAPHHRLPNPSLQPLHPLPNPNQTQPLPQPHHHRLSLAQAAKPITLPDTTANRLLPLTSLNSTRTTHLPAAHLNQPGLIPPYIAPTRPDRDPSHTLSPDPKLDTSTKPGPDPPPLAAFLFVYPRTQPRQYSTDPNLNPSPNPDRNLALHRTQTRTPSQAPNPTSTHRPYQTEHRVGPSNLNFVYLLQQQASLFNSSNFSFIQFLLCLKVAGVGICFCRPVVPLCQASPTITALEKQGTRAC